MKNRMSIKEYDQNLRSLNFQPVLKNMVRRVRWLYHNSNKLKTVYDEKLVRLMISLLEKRNKDLKEALEESITGLEWWRENYPEGASKVDLEKFQEWKKLTGSNE